MCGIYGIINGHDVAGDVLDGLRRLEYRGYDSAGVATLVQGRIERRRAAGKLEQLQSKLNTDPLLGRTGIGHTRWATHGPPTLDNAHPHSTEQVAVVHNGVIENSEDLRAELITRGHVFSSETDTEVIPYLVSDFLDSGLGPREATAETLRRLRGHYALALIFRGYDHLLIAARRGSPLAVATFEEGACLSSDGLTLAPWARQVIDLHDGDIAELRPNQIDIVDCSAHSVSRTTRDIDSESDSYTKGNFEHYTYKEILEQPCVIDRVVEGLTDPRTHRFELPDLSFFKNCSRVQIVACGTSYYAGCIARTWFEKIAELPVDVEIASEFRYRNAPFSQDMVTILISQSGETADTIVALKHAKKRGQPTIAVVNVAKSTIAREADAVLLTKAGPEIGVASTKAFTAQLMNLAIMAIAAGRTRGTLTTEREMYLSEGLSNIPNAVRETFELDTEIVKIAHVLAKETRMIFLGRGAHFPLALEGALKMKEISYIHAEGFAAGEMKHGPIALIEEGTPVVVSAPPDSLFAKTMSNVQEVIARGANALILTRNERRVPEQAQVLNMPEVDDIWTPIVYAIPLQLLAYHTARLCGRDVDRPRNLAKSVTVE